MILAAFCVPVARVKRRVLGAEGAPHDFIQIINKNDLIMIIMGAHRGPRGSPRGDEGDTPQRGKQSSIIVTDYNNKILPLLMTKYCNQR